MRFLSRQGLAFRGDGDESDGNLQQLLRLQAEKDPNLAHWLKRNENVCATPQVQNDHQNRSPSATKYCRRHTQFPICNSDGADETTDASNRAIYSHHIYVCSHKTCG